MQNRTRDLIEKQFDEVSSNPLTIRHNLATKHLEVVPNNTDVNLAWPNIVDDTVLF